VCGHYYIFLTAHPIRASAIDGVLKDRYMLEKLLIPRFMCVRVVSFNRTLYKASLCISFSIVFPFGLVLFERQILLCELKSPTSIKGFGS